MIVIFAKKNTTEKVAVECVSNLVKPKIQLMLNEKYGGDWIAVEDIKWGSILKFSDDDTYKGFKTGQKTYANIDKLY